VGIAGNQTWDIAPTFVGNAYRLLKKTGGQRPFHLTKYIALPTHHQ